MKGKIVSGTMSILLLLGMLPLAFYVQRAKAVETIYIKDDGSIDPSNASIMRNGDLYTLTGNITSGYYDGIVIERSNMTLDGAGYTIQGGWMGISFDGRSNITIKNIRIKDFYYGIYFYHASNITIFGNYISGNDRFSESILIPVLTSTFPETR
jgi:parallel beta-helix repeat protein